MRVLNAKRNNIVANVTALMSSRGNSGAYLLACLAHGLTLYTSAWHGAGAPRVAGKTIAESVNDWFSSPTARPLGVDGVYPSGQVCGPWVFDPDGLHGAYNVDGRK